MFANFRREKVQESRCNMACGLVGELATAEWGGEKVRQEGDGVDWKVSSPMYLCWKYCREL